MCKCKWFTLTQDLHAVYTAIDTYTHNTADNNCHHHPLLGPAPWGIGTVALDPTFGSFTLLEPISH